MASYDAVTENDEVQMWEKKVFDMNTAKGLSYAAFFYVGKVFGLRGGQEHHSLQVEQFTFHRDEQGNYVKYSERKAKTRQGGLKHKRFQTRTVMHYEISNYICVYKILLKYISCLEFSGKFYRRPIPTFDGQIKFSGAGIGRNTLGKYMQTIFQAAGVNMEGRKISNHSARVAQVTTLLNAGHDNFDIQQRSGHRSDVMDRYKRPSSKRKYETSKQLDIVAAARPDDVTSTHASAPATRPRDDAQADDVKDDEVCTKKLRVHVPGCVECVEVVKGNQFFHFRL